MNRKKEGKASLYLAHMLVRKQIIQEEELDIYLYGIRALGMLTLGTTVMLVIGLLLRESVYTLSFFLAFALLRAFYKGIHLRSRILCFLASEVMFFISLLGSRNIQQEDLKWMGQGLFLLYLGMSIWITIVNLKGPNPKRQDRVQRYFATLVISWIVFSTFLILIKLQLTAAAKGIMFATICMFSLVIIQNAVIITTNVRKKIRQERIKKDVEILYKKHRV